MGIVRKFSCRRWHQYHVLVLMLMAVGTYLLPVLLTMGVP